MVEASHVPFCPTKTFMQGGAPKVAELQIRIHSVGHRSVLPWWPGFGTRSFFKKSQNGISVGGQVKCADIHRYDSASVFFPSNP